MEWPGRVAEGGTAHNNMKGTRAGGTHEDADKEADYTPYIVIDLTQTDTPPDVSKFARTDTCCRRTEIPSTDVSHRNVEVAKAETSLRSIEVVNKKLYQDPGLAKLDTPLQESKVAKTDTRHERHDQLLPPEVSPIKSSHEPPVVDVHRADTVQLPTRK